MTSNLTDERRATLLRAIEAEREFCTKLLAAEWHVTPNTVQRWRQQIRRELREARA